MLCPGMQQMVLEHEASLRDMGLEVSARAIANLTQKPEYMAPQVGIAPALLRNSRLWSFAHRRMALPWEHLELQGYNLYTEDSDKYKTSFAQVLPSVSDSAIRNMAGNAFHLRAVAAALAFVMAGTHRARVSRPHSAP